MKKSAARSAALDAAQKRFLDKVIEEILCTFNHHIDYAYHGAYLRREFSSLAKGEKVLNEKFDSDLSCSIIYDVDFQNLRKKVESYYGDSGASLSKAFPRPLARKKIYSNRCDSPVPDIESMAACDDKTGGEYGWTGNDVFTYSGYAEPRKQISGRNERRKSSAEDAWKKASEVIIAVLVEGIMANDQNAHDPAAVKSHVLNLVCPLIESGRVCRRYKHQTPLFRQKSPLRQAQHIAS